MDIRASVENTFSNYHEIPVKNIKIEDEVRKLCEQNYCGNYNKIWTCPPAVGTIDETRKIVEKYDSFLLVYEVYNVKNSFDMQGMMEGVSDFKEKLQKIKKEISKEIDFTVLGVGGCTLCKKCAIVDGEPCRRPNDAIISCEACGINVMSLMKENNLKYNNGPNTVTYIGGVLY
ncbi:MAG: DUF2284 domain-containing protein [Eubacteriaceae bacterium]